MIKHFLNFISSGHGRLEIDEPVGFDKAEFAVEQDEDRLGRDSSYGGVDMQMTLNWMPNHYFNLIKYNMEFFGFEAKVMYEMDINNETFIIGEVDFASIETDDVQYFNFSVIEDNTRTIVKRRIEVDTNLFNNLTLDIQPIDPVPVYNVLVKAKPTVNVSRWNTPASGGQQSSVVGVGGTGNAITRHFNFASRQLQYDIPDSLSYLPGVQPANFFSYIRAEENLKDVVIEITNLNFTLTGNGSGNGSVMMKYFVGTDEELTGTANGVGSQVFTLSVTNGNSQSISNGIYALPPLNINRNQKLYIWFTSFAVVANNSTTFALNSVLSSLDIKITATQVAYNTIVPMVRVIDAMRYNIKSISGLPIVAKEWDEGGPYYDQFITTQALMRNLTDKPFNINLKGILQDYVRPETNGDYQLMRDNSVLFTQEPFFYRNMLLGDFENQNGIYGVIEGYTRYYNERYKNNEFAFSYKNYASKKENETDNTYDMVHGEYKGLLPNMKVQKTKTVEVGWVRDAFMWEEARLNAYRLNDNTATSDDDKIFILDVVPLQGDNRQFTETSLLQHAVRELEPVPHLVLTNDGTFNWQLLGFTINQQFTINTGENARTYLILDITPRNLELQPLGDITTDPPVNISAENTQYTYTISPETYLTNRTSEGFAEISGLYDGNNYSNLMFTVKRNVINNYSSFLATSMLYHRGETVKTSKYINNKEAYTRLATETLHVLEGGEFVPENARLTPYIVKCKIIMTQKEYRDLENKLRSYDASGRPISGFIRTYGADGTVIMGYPAKMKWVPLTKGHKDIIGVCDVELEEKYEMFLISIYSPGLGQIVVNGELTSDSFTYDIDSYGKLSIFDGTGKRMYPPVPYNRVQVQNSTLQAGTTTQLAMWLNAIK